MGFYVHGQTKTLEQMSERWEMTELPPPFILLFQQYRMGVHTQANIGDDSDNAEGNHYRDAKLHHRLVAPVIESVRLVPGERPNAYKIFHLLVLFCSLWSGFG